MLGRFTDRARKILHLAQDEAKQLNHEYVGTEHVLLGLANEGKGVGAHLLKRLGVDLAKIVSETNRFIEPGPSIDLTGLTLPQTPRVKRAIEFAIQEACTLRHRYVGSEHLLLGLLAENDGFAAQLLQNLGLDRDRLRAELIEVVGNGKGDCPADP